MVLAVVLQVVGLLILAGGMWLLAPWAGVSVLGAGLLAMGAVLEAGS